VLIGKEDKDYSDESKSLVIMSKLPKHILIIFFTVHFLSVMSNSKSTMLYAYPDLPDLIVKSDDISLLLPYPYPTVNDEIPIRAKVFNIGGETAYNVDVKFTVALGPDNIVYNNTVTFDEIKPRCSVDTTVYWNTALTHPDFYGEIGDCEFWVKADPNDVVVESWEYNNESSITKKVALYPHEPGWPKRVSRFSQPAIADLDGVGSVEIVYASLDSVYVFDPEGNLVSPWPKYFRGVYGIVLGDIDDNGFIEIVAVSRDSIKVYDYQGNVMSDWSIKIPHSNKAFRGYPALGHVSGNQYLDVILFATPTSTQHFDSLRVLVYRYDGSLLYDFGISTLPGIYYSNGPSISDVKAGAIDEIVISYEPTADRSGVKTCVFDSSGLVDSLDYGSNQMISALVDLNNDNYADVITGGVDGKIRAYDVENNQLLWERETGGAINSSPAVGDIHHYGDNIPPWPDTVGGLVKTSPAIANINGDKYLDIIVGANNNYIYAFKHTTERIAPYPLPLFGKPSSPVIGDIDGDRKSEIILASDDGYLHVWKDMDSKVLPYSLEWPQFHHDYQRTGVFGWVGGLRGGDANPKTFSTGTTLSFSLKHTLHTKIKIYDAETNLVKTLVNQTLPQGTYNPVWFGKDDSYAFLPNGIYFIEIRIKNESKIIPVEINR
jgi:hypothetical protein